MRALAEALSYLARADIETPTLVPTVTVSPTPTITPTRTVTPTLVVPTGPVTIDYVYDPLSRLKEANYSDGWLHLQ
jgi:hypothetical protein